MVWDDKNLFSHSFGGQKSEIKVSVRLVFLEVLRKNLVHASLPALAAISKICPSLAYKPITLIFASIPIWLFPCSCVHVSNHLLSFSHKDACHWISGQHDLFPRSLITSSKTPFQNKAIFTDSVCLYLLSEGGLQLSCIFYQEMYREVKMLLSIILEKL